MFFVKAKDWCHTLKVTFLLHINLLTFTDVWYRISLLFLWSLLFCLISQKKGMNELALSPLIFVLRSLMHAQNVNAWALVNYGEQKQQILEHSCSCFYFAQFHINIEYAGIYLLFFTAIWITANKSGALKTLEGLQFWLSHDIEFNKKNPIWW